MYLQKTYRGEVQRACLCFQWMLTTGLIILSASSSSWLSAATPRKPNVLVIIADDLGWGDLGCFGNTTLRTPNIDRLADEGALLTHALAAASMCTPSRAALMTGRYPVRMGLTTSTGVRVIPFLANSGGLLPTEVTFAKLAQEQGYNTALVGKWHLGLHCSSPKDFCHHPLKHGFDYFYGLPWTNARDIGGDGVTIDIVKPFLRKGCLGVALASLLTIFWYVPKQRPCLVCFLVIVGVLLPCVTWWVASSIKLLNGLVMRNLEFIEQPVELEGLHHRFLGESRKFLRKQQGTGSPFLLVLAFTHVHTALKPTSQFKGHSQHGIYGDSVEELDWAVGEVLKELDELGIANDTFVVFTSDQGAHLEEIAPDGSRHGGFNGPFKGGKGMGGMEGAFRIPTLIRWPSQIAAGRRIDYPVSHMDLFPTIAGLVGAPLPTNVDLDGQNVLSLLTQGSPELKKHSTYDPRFLAHYCGVDIHAARWIVNETHVWKAVFASPIWLPNTTRCTFICPCRGSGVRWHDPPLLYNIAQDPSETQQIPNSTGEYKEIMPIIKQQLQRHMDGIQTVDNQLEFLNIIWYPWLQPCCKFPTCHCKEDVDVTQ